MLILPRFRAWIRDRFRLRLRERELDEELCSHLDLITDEKIREGLPLEQARRAARLEMGGLEQVKEEVRSTRSGYFLDCLLQDLRVGIRMLRKNPGFAFFAVLILALGIGANTAVFSLAHAIFLHPLPQVPEISRLVSFQESLPDGSCCQSPPASFVELKKEERVLSALAAYAWRQVTSSVQGIPEPLSAVEISPDFLGVFGGSPVIGRAFLPEEYRPGHRTVLLGHRFWQSRFGADPRAVGTTLRLDGADYLVVGVTGPRFDFPPATDLYLPMAYDGAGWNVKSPGRLHLVGQLLPGIGLSEARAAIEVTARRLEADYPKSDRHLEVRLDFLRDRVNGTLTPMFTMTLLGAALFFLLLACASVANLQFARAASRRQEMVIRSALGAGRGRTFRQLLTENLLLVLLGSLGGILLSEAGIWLLIRGMPSGTARNITGWGEIRLDNSVLLFAGGVTVLAALLSGLAPLLRNFGTDSGRPLPGAENRASQSRSSRRWGSLLAAAQVSLALILLVGAGLMIKGFRGMLRTAGRFEPRSLLTFQVNLPADRYPESRSLAAYYDQALARLSSLPGVTAACLFSAPPYSNNGVIWWEYRIPGQSDATRSYGAILQNVSPGYFAAMNLRLIEGRDFSRTDEWGTLPVAVVSESLARRRWPGKSALGQQLRLGGLDSKLPAVTIVGVADDVEYDWTDNYAEPAVYLPYRQSPSAYAYLALRSRIDPESLSDSVRRRMAALDPDLPLHELQTLELAMNGSYGGLLEIGGILLTLGLMGMLIAVVGVYGVVASSVGRRTQEIGIRVALGASPRDILAMVFRQGAVLAMLAVVAGLLGSLALTRLVSRFFFGVSPTDPLTFAVIAGALEGAALLACWLPARRAMRVDPLVALRHE